MSPLHIDFAPRGWRRTLHRTHPAAWLAAAIAVATLAGASVMYYQMDKEQQDYEAQLAAAGVQARVAAARLPAPAVQQQIPEAQAHAVNAVVSQLNLPWRALQDALDAGTPQSIALLEVEPDARRRTLRVTAEAKDSEGMVGYVEQLKRQELFADVVLMRHEINEEDPNKPLRFQLEATWSAP